ncbi:hypothetical protein FHG87_007676 [Trinorchestia longiramus]|nr:hypothetical protein FHG87_007676 [Trinorchestia longiramus]
MAPLQASVTTRLAVGTEEVHPVLNSLSNLFYWYRPPPPPASHTLRQELSKSTSPASTLITFRNQHPANSRAEESRNQPSCLRTGWGSNNSRTNKKCTLPTRYALQLYTSQRTTGKMSVPQHSDVKTCAKKNQQLISYSNAKYKDFKVVTQRKVVSHLLVEPSNILLPSLHIKLGLMKNFVKALNREGGGFTFLHQKYQRKCVEKIKAGIFDGPQIRKLVVNSMAPL